MIPVHSSSGFALPSILLLVVLLTAVAFLTILQTHLERAIVLREVSNQKADNASQSGIANALASPNRTGTREFKYQYSDGSSSNAKLVPWGSLIYVWSEGRHNTCVSTRGLLAAANPVGPFLNAIVLGNLSHQLIITGSSAIVGDVVTGLPGVGTGSLRDTPSPSRFPVNGSVSRVSASPIPHAIFPGLQTEISRFQRLTTEPGQLQISGNNEPLPDSIGIVRLRSEAISGLRVTRRSRPLIIVAEEGVVVRRGSEIKGLVALISPDSIAIEEGCDIEGAIFYGASMIRIKGAASGQFFAPDIRVESGALVKYPSFLFSLDGISKEPRSIVVANGCKVEGTIAFIGQPKNNNELVVISEGAQVVGAIYSNANVSLEGSVIGSVIAQDFYFYRAPTEYFGWIRNAHVDRRSLPKGFLVPPGFSDNAQLSVLQWL